MNRIIKAFESATDEQYKQGINWYSEANKFAESLSSDVYLAAGVIAALSPQVRWETNKNAAKIIIEAANREAPMPVVAGWTRNRKKAWRIAKGEDPFVVLNEPRPEFLKVRRFFGNILGEEDLVTVDTWTAEVAMPHPPRSIVGKIYLDIERRFQKAAKILGVAPRDLQAVCWVTRRGKG